MKLTIEEDRDRIRRFRHIKPAPRGGAILCSARCPGTIRTCTLKRGHEGPHVAHGSFKKVVAVWEKGIRIPETGRDGPGGLESISRGGSRAGGPASALAAFKDRFLRKEHQIEEVIFLILALAMTGFAVDWALHILGLR